MRFAILLAFRGIADFRFILTPRFDPEQIGILIRHKLNLATLFEYEISLINVHVIESLAGDPARTPLSGDNLQVDLDFGVYPAHDRRW